MSKAKKLKKPLDLPLGKATSHKDVDLSHVRLPIDTSVLGLKNVLTLFDTATNEVKSYLAYECDLMYECKICRTIFRSIANFILHKRKFCRDKFNIPRDPDQRCPETDGVAVIQKDIETANKIIVETEDPDSKKNPGSSLNPIIENLLKRHAQKKLVDEIKNESSVIPPKTEEKKKMGDLRGIALEKIDTSGVAVFQTMQFGPNLGETELMKSEVMEIHSIFDRNEAVLNSKGEIISFDMKEKNKDISNKTDYLCTECNLKFLTKKSLAHHVKTKHGQTRLVYPCPLCKDNLCNAWSVYRHLLKVHRLTSNQIRKYRTQVHNSAICKKPEESKDKRRNSKELTGKDNENEWLDNVEGDSDLQMCGGCGKHFDRKAALISHSVMCTKRIAVCNSIKENNSKKKESDTKENAEKSASKSQVRGSGRRKPDNVIMYKPKNISKEIQIEENNTKKEVKPQVEEVIPSIVEDNDSDVEITNEWMKKDVPSYDKDELMSIIGVDTSSSNDRTSPSSDKNMSSEHSDSNSPCKGFESRTPEFSENLLLKGLEDLKKKTEDVFKSHSSLSDSKNPLENSKQEIPEFTENLLLKGMKDLKSMTEDVLKSYPSVSVSENPLENSKQQTHEFTENLHLKGIADLKKKTEDVFKSYPGISELKYSPENSKTESKLMKNPENQIVELESSETSSNCPKSPTGNEMDSSSDISLDNKIDSDFKLDLGNDPNFIDISIKPLIKEIIDEDVDSDEKTAEQDKEVVKTELSIVNGVKDTVINSSVTNVINEQNIDNNNTSVVSSSTSPNSKKRKRSTSPNQEKSVKTFISSLDETVSETENTAFMLKISKYINRGSLTCSLCNSEFDSLGRLMFHMSDHFSWYRYQCSKCLFMSFGRNDCEEHVRKHHESCAVIHATVLPIPTWKSSLISDNSTHLENTSNDEAKEIVNLESSDVPIDQLELHDASIEEDEKVVEATPKSVVLNNQPELHEVSTSVEVKFVDLEISNIEVKESDLEVSSTNPSATQVEENNIVGFIDLTIDETPDENIDDLECSLQLIEAADTIQDLSKQAIMEVILGNDHKKESPKSSPDQPCEYVRPLRNRTKSIKASQKDFIYDFDTPKNASLKGHCSRGESTEPFKTFEFQE